MIRLRKLVSVSLRKPSHSLSDANKFVNKYSSSTLYSHLSKDNPDVSIREGHFYGKNPENCKSEGKLDYWKQVTCAPEAHQAEHCFHFFRFQFSPCLVTVLIA